MERKEILLRAAYDLLKRADKSFYVLDSMRILIRYDDANCDGNCLMIDIAAELDLDDYEEPIPLGKDEEE